MNTAELLIIRIIYLKVNLKKTKEKKFFCTCTIKYPISPQENYCPNGGFK